MKFPARARSGPIGFAFGLGVAVVGLLTVTGIAPIASADGEPPAASVAVDTPSPLPPKAPLVLTTPNEDTYVPLTPCRIVDTREGTGTNGTPFQPQQTRTYYVGGTFGFAPAGGKSGGCGIPVGATAIAATITAVDPTHGGYLRAWPNGSTEPTATVLNFKDTSISTGVTLPINQTSAYSLKLRSYGNTDIVVDVAGYYAKPMSALIQSDGVSYDGTSRVQNSGRLGVGSYWVQFDRDITYCQAQANAYNTATYARVDTFTDASTTRVRVLTYNSVGTATDSWFYLTVTC